MPTPRTRAAGALALLLAGAALTGCSSDDGSTGAAAEGGSDFPTDPITFVVGFAPGGGGDVFSRALAESSAETIPERLVVENRAGAGGTTANAYVSGRPADGYTILFGHAGSTILTPLISDSPDLKWDAFQPVARIHAEEEFLFMQPDAEQDDIAGMMEYAADNPGQVRVCGSAVGGVDSFVALQLEEAAGVDLTYVPFDGGGPASLSFLGGNCELLVGNVSDNVASIEAGDMVPAAVASEERSEVAPDAPTLVENGWDVVLQQWRGVFAPEGTPEDVVQVLADGFEQALETDRWAQYREQSSSVDQFLGPEEFAAFLQEQEDLFAPIIEELGLQEG